MSEAKTVLVINPGSTSTKVALFRDKTQASAETLTHPAEALAAFPAINDQLAFRKEAVSDYLKRAGVPAAGLSAIAVRGGVVGALESGAYLVNEAFVAASLASKAPHAANLAPAIGYALAQEAGGAIPVYVYDAVCGCGTPERIFTLSGMPAVERPFLTHVLNTRAVSLRQAELDGKPIGDTAYIVMHLGGGVTTNLVVGGRIRDIVGDDEGGFSPERSGGVPCRALVRLCYSGKYRVDEMQRMLKGKGGMLAYLGTSDIRDAEKRIDAGDETARLVYEAMVLQLAKDVGALATVVCGKVDRILLTGGMAYSARFTGMLKARVEFLAPVSVIPGSMEMEALAYGILRVLNGEEAFRTI